MANNQNKIVSLELNEGQLEAIKHFFGHNDWDVKIVSQSAAGNAEIGGISNEQSTQTDFEDTLQDGDGNDFPDFVIPQLESEEECEYCFCKPCITSETNKQMWWPESCELPHQRNSSLRKEHYKRFWTMMLHRGAWNDDRYLTMKADALSRYNRQRYDWHKRDIMPKCVVSLVRKWFPNPGGFPYMGHMWD